MPFVPFFVLFGEVITNPRSMMTVSDLHLLRQTVLYFLAFQKFHASAVKLEKVAETFTTMAEAYIRHDLRTQTGSTSDAQRSNLSIGSGKSTGAFISAATTAAQSA